jgi:hypothetical protein
MYPFGANQRRDTMTQSQKHIRAKLSLLELGELLNHVSQACRTMGVSRQHFYDIKQADEEGGIEALREQSRRKPNLRNQVAVELEEIIVKLAEEFPAYGQVRAANELRQRGHSISAGGIRSVWLRHDLEPFKKGLKRLEEKSAREGIVLTESQLQALEFSRRAQR